MTAAKRSSFERKNCITWEASTPASAAIRRIVVPAKPSRANRALAASSTACLVLPGPGLRPRRTPVAGASSWAVIRRV